MTTSGEPEWDFPKPQQKSGTSAINRTNAGSLKSCNRTAPRAKNKSQKVLAREIKYTRQALRESEAAEPTLRISLRQKLHIFS
jgi:ribosome-binding protein aMBF1 (putative translation factor)